MLRHAAEQYLWSYMYGSRVSQPPNAAFPTLAVGSRLLTISSFLTDPSLLSSFSGPVPLGMEVSRWGRRPRRAAKCSQVGAADIVSFDVEKDMSCFQSEFA